MSETASPHYDVQVRVRPEYLPEQSDAAAKRFVFAYHVTITNRGMRVAKLMTRHWIIQDGNGDIQEVRGDGVIGQQPSIAPGRSYEYTSGCVLTTEVGTMEGSYQMLADDGVYFEAVIPRFTLALPRTLH